MRKIGEKVVYCSYGVMEIVDVREERFLDAVKKYYVLEPAGLRSASQTFVPVDNELLVSKMRPLLTKEEAVELIKNMDKIPDADWVDDNRARAEHFKAIVETGDREKMIGMIKLVTKTGKRREAEGKKNYLADENVMHKAQKLLYSELSIVLSIDESEIPDFIESEKNK